jgi:alpha-tubulin suppressor-like RCC1 family protein
MALCEDNELYAWGNSMHGECGIEEFVESSRPRLVKMPKGDSQL